MIGERSYSLAVVLHATDSYRLLTGLERQSGRMTVRFISCGRLECCRIDRNLLPRERARYARSVPLVTNKHPQPPFEGASIDIRRE